ncbi:hypothetical protein U1Q18_030852, partial [Sarracenia purpurea var. burkii]
MGARLAWKELRPPLSLWFLVLGIGEGIAQLEHPRWTELLHLSLFSLAHFILLESS